MNTQKIEIEITDKHIVATRLKIKKIADSVTADWLMPTILYAEVTPYQLCQIKKLNVVVKPEGQAVQTHK